MAIALAVRLMITIAAAAFAMSVPGLEPVAPSPWRSGPVR
jgi:hypothetical protein